MAIKTIEYEVTSSGITPATEQFAGTKGDHRVTKLNIYVSNDLYDEIVDNIGDGKAMYRFDVYDGEGGIWSSEASEFTNPNLSIELEERHTRFGGKITVYLVITALSSDNETEMELYSFPARLRLNDKPEGIKKDGENYESITGLVEIAKTKADEAADTVDEAVARLEETAKITFGKSAYQLAVENGFEGTESDWLASLKGQKGDKGDAFTYDDLTDEQKAELKEGIEQCAADQAYSPTSENAQSGKAVAEAVSNFVPITTNTDYYPYVYVQEEQSEIPSVLGADRTDGYMEATSDNGALPDGDLSEFGGFIARRKRNGNLLSGTPKTKHEVANKKYVDENSGGNLKNGSNKTYSVYQESEKDDSAITLSFTDLPVEDKTNIAGIYNRKESLGVNATALGTSVATGKRSFAAGSSNVAAEEKAIALGCDNYANGKQSAAIGYANYTEGVSAIAMGSSNKALGEASFAQGSKCIAKGNISAAMGTGSQANGLYSFAHGNKTIADYNNQFVVGRFNKPVDAMFVVGNGNDDSNRGNAFVMYGNGSAELGYPETEAYLGDKFIATQGYVNALKKLAQSGELTGISLTGAGSGYSIEQWYGGNKARNTNASAFGCGTTASGADSHSQGMGTIASGDHSHAEGWKSTASAACAHAENCNTTASGENSHSEGMQCVASGANSHAEGSGTKAEGHSSHAQGTGSIASGLYSSAAGNQSRAGYNNQFVVGKFNNNKEDTLFEVGCGANDTERANCFETGKDTDGNAFIRIGETKVTEAQLKKLLALIG